MVDLLPLDTMELKCDRCGCESFDRVDVVKYRKIGQVFGPDVILCRKCGAVRYPGEVGGISAPKIIQ